MSLFRHPHLTRGVIRTPHGAFTITRGIVDVPDEVGRALGWLPVEEEDESARDARKFLSRQSAPPDAPSAGDAY
jgi:hypothetical protein